MAESLFATLECELIDRRAFRTQADARMAIFEFIEGWYNRKRRHSALGYLSFKRLTAGYSAAERALLFHDTAVRVYRLACGANGACPTGGQR